MHEATIASSILQIVGERLRQAGCRTARQVHLIVGEFRNVDPECLQFAFENLRMSYPGLNKCRLIIESIKAQASCQDNNHLYHPDCAQSFRCQICGSGIGKLICGEELDIVNMTFRSSTHQETKSYA